MPNQEQQAESVLPETRMNGDSVQVRVRRSGLQAEPIYVVPQQQQKPGDEFVGIGNLEIKFSVPATFAQASRWLGGSALGNHAPAVLQPTRGPELDIPTRSIDQHPSQALAPTVDTVPILTDPKPQDEKVAPVIYEGTRSNRWVSMGVIALMAGAIFVPVGLAVTGGDKAVNACFKKGIASIFDDPICFDNSFFDDYNVKNIFRIDLLGKK